MIGFLVVNPTGISMQPNNLSVRQRYRALRQDKPWIDPKSALRIVRSQIERAVRHRLLGMPTVHDGPYNTTYAVGDRLVKVQFDSDNNYLRSDDSYKYYPTEDRLPRFKGMSLDTPIYRLKTGGQIRLLYWTEEDAYKSYRDSKLGKANARRSAIESRQEQVRRVEQIHRGDIGSYCIKFECDGVNMDEFTDGCTTSFESDDEESMREHVEDALEFVLRSTQDFKEPA